MTVINDTELNKIPTPAPASEVTTPVVPPVEVEKVFDNHGYEVAPAVEVIPPKVEETPVEVVAPISGYDGKIPTPVQTPPAAEPVVEVIPPVAQTPEEKLAADKLAAEKLAAEPVAQTPEEIKRDIDIALGDSPDKDLISKFAVDNKLTKEQVANYAALIKNEDAKHLADMELQKQQQAIDWKQELADDNTFGGENLVVSTDKVNKLVKKHMPDTFKRLTDSGKMLPPYIMKDLLRLSDALNPTTNLINGEPSTAVVKEGENWLDDMYN